MPSPFFVSYFVHFTAVALRLGTGRNKQTELIEQLKPEFQEAFDLFDTDGSGSVKVTCELGGLRGAAR